MGTLGFDPTNAEVREMVVDADTDEDGAIKYSEFEEVVVRNMLQLDPQDRLVSTLHFIRSMSSWEPLLFDERGDEEGSLSFQGLRRTARELSKRMTEEELQDLLKVGDGMESASRAAAVAATTVHSPTLPAKRTPKSSAADASKMPVDLQARGSSTHMVHRFLSAVSIKLMRNSTTAAFMTRVLKWPGVALALTPIFSLGYLRTVLSHEHAWEAITTLLRTRHAAGGIAAMLRYHRILAAWCAEPDAPKRVASFVGVPGLGEFLREFFCTADHRDIARLLRYASTARLMAVVIRGSDPLLAAESVHRRQKALVAAFSRVCLDPGSGLWAARVCNRPGVDAWLGAFLEDPRGAAFAHRVLLSPGFIDWVDMFLRCRGPAAFVARLLRRPGVQRFVTWLNRDEEMWRWFAQIARRDSAMVLVTEMLLEPGLDRVMVDLLLRRGNDAALRAMLEQWVRAERSLGEMVNSFAQKPRAARALARVIISPGFIFPFVLRRLLLQPGLAEVAVEAVVLVGVRGLLETVLPLAVSTLAVIVTLFYEDRVLMEQLGPILAELPSVDQLLNVVAAVLL